MLPLLAPKALPLLAPAPKPVPVPNAEVAGALAPPAPKPAPVPTAAAPKEKAGADVLPAPAVGALLPNADGAALVAALPVVLAAALDPPNEKPPAAAGADVPLELPPPPKEKPAEAAGGAEATANPVEAAGNDAVAGPLLLASAAASALAPGSVPLLLPNEKAAGGCGADEDVDASVLAAGAVAALALPDVDTAKLEPVDAPVLEEPNEKATAGLSPAVDVPAAAAGAPELAPAPALLAELPNPNAALDVPASLAADPGAGASKVGTGGFLLPLPSPCAADAALEPNGRAGALPAAASPAAGAFDAWGAGVGGGGGLGGAMLTTAGVEQKMRSSARIVAAARCIL